VRKIVKLALPDRIRGGGDRKPQAAPETAEPILLAA
jgi:hypothetical protein